MTCGTESLLCASTLDVPELMDSVQQMIWTDIPRANIHWLLHSRNLQKGTVAMSKDVSPKISHGRALITSGAI